MKRILPIVLLVLTVVLIATATIRPSEGPSSKSPEGAVQAMFNRVRAHDYGGAYDYVAKSSNTLRPRRFARIHAMGSLACSPTSPSMNPADASVVMAQATAVGPVYSRYSR